jgi:hypothetical protein
MYTQNIQNYGERFIRSDVCNFHWSNVVRLKIIAKRYWKTFYVMGKTLQIKSMEKGSLGCLQHRVKSTDTSFCMRTRESVFWGLML